jgi:homoserine O-acetyltransferase
MMLDSVAHLQVLVPDGPAADRFIADARSQAISMDANDILYSLSSSADYDPQPRLTAIETKVYALNFADAEFNPAELHVLEELMPRVREGRFIVQPASAESFGHLTMAHPELWSEHVAEFMRSLGDEALHSSIER